MTCDGRRVAPDERVNAARALVAYFSTPLDPGGAPRRIARGEVADIAGYQQLRRLLHVWSLTAIAASHPGSYEELAAVRAGAATTVAVTDAIPDWAERVAAARDRR
jgi:hypothetical protein